ncbi:hypothetical protein DUNSADRAFT_17453 [Dunaliella salina]|uniref:Uncharacterized protein n=1 Tax=Dunaliella salina TaxID=3046 RepID=A0ABQ7G1T0_DUNSA|nr:hypothetical protein DUNSADRAFT_17453 [Dunaliella salina]|eukprot:KAF5828555.1 hypothetical protein DUNSADRAFT_17453 [Dunaliella salina]
MCLPCLNWYRKVFPAYMDQVSANIGFYGSPSPITICCVLFALLSVNASCYVFLLQVVYRVLLQSMGYSMGPLPGIIKKYLYAGMPDPEDAKEK